MNFTNLVIPCLFAAVLSVIGWLVRYIDSQKQRELDRRMAEEVKAREELKSEVKELRSDNKTLTAQLHTNDVLTVEMKGEITRLKDFHTGLDKDIEEIKKQQVPRMEFERAMETLTDLVRETKGVVDRIQQAGYVRQGFGPLPPPSSGSSPRHEAVKPR